MVAGYFAPDFITRHPEEVRRVEQTEASTAPHGFANAARANAARNWSDRLGAITCPTLFVGGELDPADPVRNAAIFRRHLRDLEVHILPGVSHLLPLEVPERFNEILLNFLKRVEAQG
jgi:3-oxoadipate enol-lactonase